MDKEYIDAFLASQEQQLAATPETWAALYEAVQTVFAGKSVAMLNYKHKLDAAKKSLKQLSQAAAEAAKLASAKTVNKASLETGKCRCRSCGAPLAPTAKAVSEHYEKKHYAEFIKNKAVIASHPHVFVVSK